jgi:hypothetical protein
MSNAEQLPENYQIDIVPEEKMAELVFTTRRALQSRRARGVIPQGVWNTIDGKVYYSIRRYEQWLESLWSCPPEWNSSARQSESASPGKGNGAVKPSAFPRRPRESRRHPIYVLT